MNDDTLDPTPWAGLTVEDYLRHLSYDCDACLGNFFMYKQRNRNFIKKFLLIFIFQGNELLWTTVPLNAQIPVLVRLVRFAKPNDLMLDAKITAASHGHQLQLQLWLKTLFYNLKWSYIINLSLPNH